MKTKVLCILPRHDPRISLRIKMLQQAGFQVEVVAFDSRRHPGRHPKCPTELLGRLLSESYYLRIWEILLRVPKIRAAIRRNHVAYAFHIEMGLVALASGVGLARPLVVEVHDIKRHLLARGPKGWVVRFVDRFISRACSLLVLTTAGYHAYYRDWLGLEPSSLVIENKVEGSYAAAVLAKGGSGSHAGPLESRPLRIGYFGFLRDEWSMRLLEALAKSAPDRFQIVLAGTVVRIDGLLQRVAQHENMEHRGTYVNPDDLEGLYTDVDMVLSCYPPVQPFGWSQSNRYYEACLFRRPLIVRAGTGDAVEVERHQIGLVIADDDVEAAAAAVRGIAPVEWHRWQANMAKLPLTAFAYTNEADQLGCALSRVTGRGYSQQSQPECRQPPTR